MDRVSQEDLVVRRSMSKTDWIEDLRSNPEGRRLLERERLWVEATETLCKLMESQGITSVELARRLQVSPARVSQLLSGTRNLTLASLADAFQALGRSLHVVHGPPTEKVRIGRGRTGVRKSSTRTKTPGRGAPGRSPNRRA